MKEYYVYCAYGLNDELLYVGKGQGLRWKHCISGTSHCKGLNEYYFKNGGEASIRVVREFLFDTDEEALKCEIEVIKERNPIFNKDHTKTDRVLIKELPLVERIQLGYVVDYRDVMKTYLSALENNERTFINLIDNIFPEYSVHVECLGAKKIKALKYRKKDVEQEYNLVKLKDSKFFDVVKSIPVQSGDIVSVKEAKEMVSTAFNDTGIKKKVTAKVFEDYFHVEHKVITINGIRQRAYKVLSVKNTNLLY